MKKFLRVGLLLALAVLLLTTTAFADSGPKPQLTVRVVNAPEEPYYLDLLFPGDYEDYSHGFSPSSAYRGLDWNYTPEEIAALDQDLLDALRAAVPEGWCAAVAEGGDAPIWGDLYAEEHTADGDPVHTYGYLLPDTYRLLLVTASGETFLSEPHTRRTLQSTVALDWAEQSLTIPPIWQDYTVQFLTTLLPTLLLEGLLLVLFGFPWSQNWKPFLLVNLITQGGLALYAAFIVLRHGAGAWSLLPLIPAEAAITLAEALLYRRFLTGQSKAHAVVYGIFANLCSAALGVIVMDYVWRCIVSIL